MHDERKLSVDNINYLCNVYLDNGMKLYDGYETNLD